jgi:hypothetical protein
LEELLGSGERLAVSTQPAHDNKDSAARLAPRDPTDPHRHPSAGTGFPIALGISKKRLLLAFVIAALSDGICFFATPIPPIVWAVDLLTATALFLILGWHWLLLPGLIMEAIPGIGMIPIWLLVVAAIAVWGTARPNLKWPASVHESVLNCVA